MPKHLQWLFPRIVLTKDQNADFPTLNIDEAELNILWFLGKEGPKSIYELGNTKYELPRHLPASVWCLDAKEWDKRSEKKMTYHYSFVHKTVRKLEREGLVSTIKDTSGDRIKRTVKLTFQGLFLYMENSDDKNKFIHALEHYPTFIPFAEQWNSILKHLGEERVTKALELTFKGFHVDKVKFHVRSLKMEFEGFLETDLILSSLTSQSEQVIRQRDKEVERYLKRNEALILKNSYIAYLAAQDIDFLSGRDETEVESLLDKLESEEELALLEEKEGIRSQLFKGKRLKEFLPRYADVEYFFTGRFVKNLLWQESVVIQKSNNKPSPFEVEY